MSPTPEDYAQKVIDAVIDGALNLNKYQDVKKFIAVQIAAAIAAEHQRTLEECAKVAQDMIGADHQEIASAILSLK